MKLLGGGRITTSDSQPAPTERTLSETQVTQNIRMPVEIAFAELQNHERSMYQLERSKPESAYQLVGE